MKHLKLFQTEAEYTAYKNGDEFITPNVSYAVDSTKKFYNPLVESYKMVDLGLPSGLKWADRNVGASSPEDHGLYFQWGDTVGYTAEQVEAGEKTFADVYWSGYFDTSNYGYTFNKYATDKLTVLEAADDAASVNMGSDWRMPTQADFEELINNTTVTYIDLQGNEFSREDVENNANNVIAEGNLKGVRFIGTNGNSIFIPAAGHTHSIVGDATMGYGMWGINSTVYVWSSSLYPSDLSDFAYELMIYNIFDYNIMNVNESRRYYGQSVRGVCN